MIGLYTVSSQVSDMARRRMKTKIQPAVLSMVFSTGTIPAADKGVPGQRSFYIDLSQCASLMNRRFYRQGLNWAVSGFKVLTAGFEGGVTIGKLPNTWVMSNAWEKGFRAWQQMIKNATEDSGTQSVKGKFLDFKIFADGEHHDATFDKNLLPIDADSNVAIPGQWQPAEIELPSTTGSPGQSFAYEIIAVGPNHASTIGGLDAKSLINGYAASRALPYHEDPNVPEDASSTSENWMLGLFNDGTNQDGDVVQMLEVTGDEAPYPYEGALDPAGVAYTDTQYPGGANNLQALEIHDYEFVTPTTVGGTTRMKGGNFPCGLIKIDARNSAAQSHNIVLQIDLIPGKHRGYLCESMTEM